MTGFAVAGVLVVLIATWLGTAGMLWYSSVVGLIDQPGARRSHDRPTPRGGGVSIAAVVLAAAAAATGLHAIDMDVGRAMCIGGLLVAAIGAIDDHRPTPAWLRLGVHFVAAGSAIYFLHGFNSIRLGDTTLHLGVFGAPLAAIATVWSINFYNFMDGVDGIAGSEGALVGAFGAVLLVMTHRPDLAFLAATVAAACVGFLVWNWSPAKIFMGDAGSGFLGYILAVLAMTSERQGAVPALVWVALMSVFLIDATVTLVRRAWRRERLTDAHREHAYQRLQRHAGWSHRQITGAVIVTNLAIGAVCLVGARAGFSWKITIAAVAIALIGYVAADSVSRSHAQS